MDTIKILILILGIIFTGLEYAMENPGLDKELENSEILQKEQSYNYDVAHSLRFFADPLSKEFCFALTMPSEPSSFIPLKTIKPPLNRYPFSEKFAKLKTFGMFKFKDDTFGIAYAKIPGEYQLLLIPFKSKINTAVLGLTSKTKSINMKKLRNERLIAELTLANQDVIEKVIVVYTDDLTKVEDVFTFTKSGYKKLDWLQKPPY